MAFNALYLALKPDFCRYRELGILIGIASINPVTILLIKRFIYIDTYS